MSPSTPNRPFSNKVSELEVDHRHIARTAEVRSRLPDTLLTAVNQQLCSNSNPGHSAALNRGRAVYGGGHEGRRPNHDRNRRRSPGRAQGPADDRLGGLYLETQPADNKFPGLTGREQDVLHLLAEGRSNRAIARQLGLSEATVKGHISGC